MLGWRFRDLFLCAFTLDRQKHLLLPWRRFSTSVWLRLGPLPCLIAATGEAAFECVHEVDDVLAARTGFRFNGSPGTLCVDQIGESGFVAILELLGIKPLGIFARQYVLRDPAFPS